MYCGIVEDVAHKKNGCGIGPASGGAGCMTHLFKHKYLDEIW